MIVHAAFLPHSPLLLESIHPENRKEFAQTEDAIKSVAENLYALKPDVLCIISGHGDRYSDAFSIDVAEKYITDLRPFGDMTKPTVHKPSMPLIDKLQRHLRASETPFTLTTNETLEYGTAVSVRLLADQMPSVRLLPIAYSDLSHKEHFAFGQTLREVLEESDLRIAIIGTGDLSHCLSSDAPGGFCKNGKVFDDAVVKALSQNSSSALLSIDESIIEEAEESGYRSLLILLGILDKKLFETEVLSYETPFGVGYLVSEFHVR